jgi:membrane protein YqaA with SNARE-associated domain
MWRRLYEATLRAARHRHAERYLAALSFAESSFFPIPPDVMLAPMVMARRERAWRLAAITTAMSVAGALLGYVLGYFLLETITPWLRAMGYWEGYLTVREWFGAWGFWAILLAGFTPIPYKLFTIAAGAAAMPLLPFVAASLVARSARFFLVAGLVRWLGPVFEQRVLKYIDLVGWLLLIVIVLGWLVYRF